MGLREMAATAKKPKEVDEASARADIEAAVQAAITAGVDTAVVRVPHRLHGELMQWVEGEGMRCRCEVQAGRVALLYIMPGLKPPPAPLPPPAPTPVEVSRLAALEARIEALEAGGRR